MKKPFYTPAARQDLVDILNYIARDRSDAAIAWVEKIEAKCFLIASTPDIGDSQPHLGNGVRAIAIGRYVVFHRGANDRVEILRVIPGDRHITKL
ncbi:MAG: type II toxin-antitoxin system RelE/ParE family toxin [Planctomycetes bacterium]|nr:type II toxin-antitoxin system RelE/ParE family toxin [Planctomycetota bacterium]